MLPEDSESKLDRIADMLQLQLVTMMRVYDVLLAVLHKQNPEAASNIMSKHENWDYIGPLPFVEEDDT